MNELFALNFLFLSLWATIDSYETPKNRVVRQSNNFSSVDHETAVNSSDACLAEHGQSETLRRKRSDETPAETPTVFNFSRFSEEFQRCAHSQVEKGCYIVLPNGSVHVPLYRRVFDVADYFIDENFELNVCSGFFDDFHDDTKFSYTLAVVSVVGTALSAFCILLHVGMFIAFKKLRNLPGYCLFSLCLALLIAYLCSYVNFARSLEADCTALGILRAYAFLSSFFWMNAMAYDIWRSLRMATAKLRLMGDKPMFVRFGMYSVYSWGSPLAIITVGIIVDNSDSDPKYRLTMARDTCWFEYKQALLVYFALPLFFLLFLNVVLFVSSFCMIHSATMNTSENRADLWSRFLVCARLAVVMGLMWIFGVLATAAEATWLWYFSVLCNVLQGVFIFFSFTFTEKTRKACSKVIQKKKSSVFPSQSTHHSTSV